jgi:hypothetical protein
MPADDREHSVVGAGSLDRAVGRRRVDPDGRQPRDPHRPRARDYLRVGRLAVIEVAVAVDHR